MNTIQSFKSLHHHQAMSTYNSTGELKIRQLQYAKKDGEQQKDPELRAQTVGRPNTSVTKLSVTTHKLGKSRPLQAPQQDGVLFFENFMGQPMPNNNVVPDELTIRKLYRFRLPCIVETQENAKVQTHFLEGFIHSQQLVESYIQSCRMILAQVKEEANQVRKEMRIKEEETNREIDEFIVQHRQKTHRLTRQIKDDFVQHQTEQFRLNKQITILMKEKLQLDNDVQETLHSIYLLEIRLQGVECFDLETQDPLLNTITQNNLRPDRTQYSFKSGIH